MVESAGAWNVVRQAVDEKAAIGQLLLTRSAGPRHVAGQHFRASRIGLLCMSPMTLAELGRVAPTASLAAALAGHNVI